MGCIKTPTKLKGAFRVWGMIPKIGQECSLSFAPPKITIAPQKLPRKISFFTKQLFWTKIGSFTQVGPVILLMVQKSGDHHRKDVWNPVIIGKMVVPLGWGPLNNQPPIQLISLGYLLGISPFKGLLGGLKQLGYHPRVSPFSLWCK